MFRLPLYIQTDIFKDIRLVVLEVCWGSRKKAEKKYALLGLNGLFNFLVIVSFHHGNLIVNGNIGLAF